MQSIRASYTTYESSSMMRSLKSVLVLLSILLPALLLGLGERPVYKIQEVRIAETAREMLESGDWMVPRYNGELRLQKPPLPYWLTAASYRVAGVSEVSTRLPAVFFALLTALLVGLVVRREGGATMAANSMLVLVVSFIGLRYFRSGEADAVLLFFVTASSLLGHDIQQGRTDTLRRWLFGLALGLGFLSKGPAALAIPLLALLLAGLLERKAGRPPSSFRALFSWPGMLTLLVAAFGWYAWILWQYPEIGRSFFGKQVDETFVSGTHAKAVWWYLAHWIEFFAPWGILLIPAGWMAYRRWGGMPPLVRFSWVWLGVVFILLTATVNKQMQYALLFAPPLAVVLGHYLVRAEGGFARTNRILFFLFGIAVVAACVVALRKSNGGALAGLWLLIPVAPILMQRLLRERLLSVPVLLVAGLTAMLFLYSEAFLSKEPRKVAAQAVMAEAIRHAPLYQVRTSLNDGALSFHAGRVVPPAGPTEIAAQLENHEELWLVGESLPEMPGVDAQVVTQVDDLKLYRVRRKP
jgi:4-amino-4-deoxy-L-arabinose transferase-like glycosyltransferase